MTFALLVVGAAAALAAFLATSAQVTVILMSVAAFCGQAGGVSGFSLAIAFGGKRVATVFAAVNMSGNIGASLFPVVVGRVARETGNWNYTLLLFAAMFIIGAACWAVLNPRGTLFQEEAAGG
jgi:MFS family permease